MNEKIRALIQNSLKSLWEHVTDLKANEDGSNTFKVVASTSDVDRAGDSLEVDKWDDSNFKKNPVIMADHNYEVKNIVGKMTKLYKEWQKLMLEGIFTEDTEYGKTCMKLYNSGFLKAVSVGFITHRDSHWKVLSYELLEVSFVAIPCHPDALSTEWKKLIKKGIDLWIIKDFSVEKVSATGLKVWDVITYRHVYREPGEKTRVYPRKEELPFMWKVLQKLDNDEELLKWGSKVLVAKLENPIITLQDYTRSKDWPKMMTSSTGVFEYSELEIDRVIGKKEVSSFKDFTPKEESMNEKQFLELKDEVKGIKDTLSLLADGKALPGESLEDGNSKEQFEAIHKAFQWFGKSVSEALCQMKQAKKN